MTRSPAATNTPEHIGPYRVLRRLGAGGMGEVFLAERVGAGGFRRRCCVKTVLPMHAHRHQLLELFEREAVLAARVSHENVVQVFDFGQEGATLYLAMEVVDGISGRALLEHAKRSGTKLTIAEACAIVVDVARGLAAVHGLVADDGAPVGLIHRDVTPDNILITKDGLSKLGDFGVARAQDSQPMTETGTARGKLPYLAPEQVDGEHTTQAADVWALGISFFQLLTGGRPFDRGTELGTMNAIVSEPMPELTTLRPDAPRALHNVLSAMLDKHPSRRPSARAVVDTILACVPQAAARPSALVASAMLPNLDDPTLEAGVDIPERAARVLDRTETDEPQVKGGRWASAGKTLAVVLALALVIGVAIGTAFAFGHWRGERTAPIDLAQAAVVPTPAPAPEAAAAPTPQVPASDGVDADAVVAAAETEPEQPRADPAPASSARRSNPGVEVALIAPPQVRWFAGKSAIGRGSSSVRTAARALIAVDDVTGGRTTVTIENGRADYSAIKTGTLDVRAQPFADVTVGSRKFGNTPLVPKPKLVAGSYVVVLRHEGVEQRHAITVTESGNTVVRANMSKTSEGP